MTNYISNNYFDDSTKNELDSIMNYMNTGVEFWYARDIMNYLGYAKWQNFYPVIQNGMAICAERGYNLNDHYIEYEKEIRVGNRGGSKKIQDFLLSRGGCYFTCAAADVTKPKVKQAMGYFMEAARRDEIAREAIDYYERKPMRTSMSIAENRLNGNCASHGVTKPVEFAIIHSAGDAGLSNRTTKEWKEELGIPTNRPLSDYVDPNIVAAKYVATNATNANIDVKNLYGTDQIAQENYSNHSIMRDAMIRMGLIPEELPPREDYKKIERHTASAEKKFFKQSDPLAIEGNIFDDGSTFKNFSDTECDLIDPIAFMD